MQTQSIIVYRNPAEAAFWEAIAQAELVPLGIGAITALMVVILVDRILGQFLSPFGRDGTIRMFCSIGTGALVGGFLGYYLLSKI